MIALNVGSGQRPFRPPWINTDIQEKWRKPTEEAGCKFQRMDELAFKDPAATVDMICLHHVLEHFGCNEADLLIKNCHDILKPGGSLLVFVPDALMLARRYAAHMIDNYTFNVNMYGAYMGDEADRHKWSYDSSSLAEYLNKWKWKTLGTFDWREIEGADIARDWWILGMECVK